MYKIYKNYMPKEEWNRILGLVPIVCIELVLRDENYFLLAKRNQEPEKNKFSITGGTILRGESINEAIRRQARRELGINVRNFKFRGVRQFYGKPSKDKSEYYAISLIYEIPSKRSIEIKLNEEHSEYKWFNKLDNTISKYSKEIIGIVKRKNGMEE